MAADVQHRFCLDVAEGQERTAGRILNPHHLKKQKQQYSMGACYSSSPQ